MAKVRSKFFLYFALIILFAVSIFVIVWQHVQITSYGYKIAHLEKEKRDLQIEQSYHKVKVANLNSPERIRKIALERLNLINPNKLEMIILKVDK
ncbi:cell division protein FtsL [bacterium]|nr:cell division protein FtsL [bacterium]MBU0900022.1 cell division protein FtsL [bacterium]MBU1153493.1 cell division protein FtsL [bacterium]